MKKIIHIPLVLIFLFLFTQSGFSQGKKQYYEAYKRLGDSCIVNKNFYGAHQAYEKALSYNNDVEVSYKCAEACRSYQNYPDAEKYYKIVLAEDSVTYKLASYWYADMLKYQGKYDLAAKEFAKYYKVNRKANDYFTKKAKLEADVCAKKIKTIVSYDNLEITRIEDTLINSMYAEYSPVQFNDTIFFFGGIRPINKEMADTSYIFSNYINQISKAYIKDSVWEYVGPEESINDPAAHVGNLSFTKNGKTAYFSKCLGYNCSIYKASFDQKTAKFSNIEKLPATINKPESSNTTPRLAMTQTGRILFFASNCKGGKGGLDIWYSRINENGTFEKPINCGPGVNTLGDEVTPFFDARDTLLYFSSEWHKSLGGFDVFSSKGNLKTDKWQPAANIGKPVNSSYNDLYYQYARDSLRAYWVSNRTESKRLISKAYSNDIYYHPLIRQSVARITDLVPIYLYFDNDQPDPRSRDTLTSRDYESLFQEFMAKKQEYIIEYTKNSASDKYEYDAKNVETFFTDLQKEYDRLFLFAQLMEVLLKDGQDIIVVFKGYASPVGNTAYNEIVAKKRISCIQNFFFEFHGGVLNQYLKNEPKSGDGSLKYGHEPIGEIKTEDTFYTSGGEQVSAISDRKQRWMSVYSPSAAYQRKIEIVAVTIEYEDELFNKIRAEVETQKKTVEDDGSAVQPIEQENTQDVQPAGTEEKIEPTETTEPNNTQDIKSDEEIILNK
jgi:tetratricopeptide (TPR) repeat protein